jgi:hypothetical protein
VSLWSPYPAPEGKLDQGLCDGVYGLQARSETSDGFSVPLELSVGQVAHVEIRHPPKRWAFELGMHLLFAAIRSDEEETLDCP